MLNGKAKVIFSIVMTLVFIAVGIKNFIGGDYLFGAIYTIAGITFIASLFLKKNGNE